MIEQIRKRVKAWKRFYAQDCKHADENSSWHEILMDLEYYRSSEFYTSGQQKLWAATKTVGPFSKEEMEFLETLPAYTTARLYLKYDDYRENFIDKIDGLEVYSMCSAKDDDIPLREYTIVTDRKELWNLEIYVFKDSLYYQCRRHGIIRYAEEPPADYVAPEHADDDITF
ncbi:MAG: hypothetical protein J6Y91_04000 [Alphaproteobacteria bacterium]|nr:hypothetical protein [Alphaproteobacteria bacterium]